MNLKFLVAHFPAIGAGAIAVLLAGCPFPWRTSPAHAALLFAMAMATAMAIVLLVAVNYLDDEEEHAVHEERLRTKLWTMYLRAFLRFTRRTPTLDEDGCVILPALSIKIRGIAVEPSTTARYANVCQLEDVQAREGAEVPPLLLAATTMPMTLFLATHPAVPLAVGGSVHMRSSIATPRRGHRARQGGVGSEASPRTYDARCTLQPRTRRHRRGTEMDTIVAVTERGSGAVVFEATSTFLVFGGRGHGRGAEPKPAGGGQFAFAQSAYDRGDVVASRALALPHDLGRAFARLSGDHNPIHTSPLGARLFGQRGVIAHGMSVAAAACELALGSAGPAAAARRATVDVVFKKPVRIPGRVTLRVRRRTAEPGEPSRAEEQQEEERGNTTAFAEVWTAGRDDASALRTVARLRIFEHES